VTICLRKQKIQASRTHFVGYSWKEPFIPLTFSIVYVPGSASALQVEAQIIANYSKY